MLSQPIVNFILNPKLNIAQAHRNLSHRNLSHRNLSSFLLTHLTLNRELNMAQARRNLSSFLSASNSGCPDTDGVRGQRMAMTLDRTSLAR